MRVVLALALLVAACGSATQATSTSTTTPTTSTLVSTTTSTSAQAGSTTTSTTEAPLPEPVMLDNPVTELMLPDGVIVDRSHPVAVGEPGWVVVAGDRAENAPRNPGFWHTRNGVDWAVTRLSDIVSIQFVEITDLVYFEGRYIASLMGDAAVVDPTVVTSEDGINWIAETIRVGGTVGVPGVFATPESPPWPGASAITDMAVRGNELVAVGWVTTDGGSSPAVWRTTDARAWSRSLLPNQVSPNEWASRVAVGEAGYLVTGLGPFHEPDYLWVSLDGDSWKPVHLTKALFSGHGGVAVGDSFFVTVLYGDRAEELYRSDDGLAWEAVHLPGADQWIGAGVRDMVGHGPNWLMLVTDPDASAWMLGDDGARYLLPLGDWPRFGWVENHRVIVASTGSTVHVMPLVADVLSYVIDVASDDVLNVRAGPGVEFEIVATLAHDATGILSRSLEVDGWQLVFGPTGQVGWVNGAFLSSES